jgi:hypothetical protein
VENHASPTGGAADSLDEAARAAMAQMEHLS